jgi:glycosyltransferase involved in cell wall biosynthesis
MRTPTKPVPVNDSSPHPDFPSGVSSRSSREIRAALLTGGIDKPYALGLAMALAAHNVHLDVIGSDEVDSPGMHATPRLTFLNLHGTLRSAPLSKKIWRVLAFYLRLARYAATASPKILHILWNNKLELFDRTVLMLYYRVLGKKIAITAHNVNAGQRDSNDSFLNRLTLGIQYRLVHHIFVHTHKMKLQLCEEFRVREGSITVIPYPVNDAIPDTDLAPAQAKQRLGIKCGEKTMLFFGRLRPYKGLEYLLSAFEQLSARDSSYRLIIAGEALKGSEAYVEDIQNQINNHVNPGQIVSRI